MLEGKAVVLEHLIIVQCPVTQESMSVNEEADVHVLTQAATHRAVSGRSA